MQIHSTTTFPQGTTQARCAPNTLSALPLTLTASDLMRILRLSRGSVYRMMQSPDFPSLRVGRRILVPRDKFLSWLDGRSTAPLEQRQNHPKTEAKDCCVW